MCQSQWQLMGAAGLGCWSVTTALRTHIGPAAHLVVYKHLADLPLYLAGNLCNAPGVCLYNIHAPTQCEHVHAFVPSQVGQLRQGGC